MRQPANSQRSMISMTDHNKWMQMDGDIWWSVTHPISDCFQAWTLLRTTGVISLDHQFQADNGCWPRKNGSFNRQEWTTWFDLQYIYMHLIELLCLCSNTLSKLSGDSPIPKNPNNIYLWQGSSPNRAAHAGLAWFSQFTGPRQRCQCLATASRSTCGNRWTWGSVLEPRPVECQLL